MSGRQCHPCNQCCKGWLHSEIMRLKPGSPCKHCTDAGCGIYETRPEHPCRTFLCGWLRDGSPMPEEMRPDLSGVIVMFKRQWMGREVISAMPTGEKIPEDSLEWLKKHAIETGTPLILLENIFENGEYKGYRQLGFGPSDFRRAVQNQVSLDDIVAF